MLSPVLEPREIESQATDRDLSLLLVDDVHALFKDPATIEALDVLDSVTTAFHSAEQSGDRSSTRRARASR